MNVWNEKKFNRTIASVQITTHTKTITRDDKLHALTFKTWNVGSLAFDTSAFQKSILFEAFMASCYCAETLITAAASVGVWALVVEVKNVIIKKTPWRFIRR